MNADLKRLAELLQQVADDIGRAGGDGTGLKVKAVAEAGSRANVTGMRVSVTAAAGSTGTVIGSQVIASSGQAPADHSLLVKELRDAAEAVRSGTAPKSWIAGLLDRAMSTVGRAVDAGTVSAAKELTASLLS